MNFHVISESPTMNRLCGATLSHHGKTGTVYSGVARAFFIGLHRRTRTLEIKKDSKAIHLIRLIDIFLWLENIFELFEWVILRLPIQGPILMTDSLC